MKHFTNSATFDINLLLNENAPRQYLRKREKSFNREAIFDVKDLFNN